MAGHLHAAEAAGDAALFVDDEGGALDAEDFFAVQGFFLEYAVEAADDAVGVAEKRVGQADLGAELFVRGEAVAADAEYFGAGGDDFGVDVAKLASFVRSAGGVVFGVEEEDDLFAAVVAEAARRTAGGREREVRRRGPCSEFAHVFPFFRIVFPVSLACVYYNTRRCR
jgi:hypothetical protein